MKWKQQLNIFGRVFRWGYLSVIPETRKLQASVHEQAPRVSSASDLLSISSDFPFAKLAPNGSV